jgi:hypothetical protein
MLRLLFYALAVLVVCQTLARVAQAEETVTRKALLIGVTAYPHVGKEFQLQGPANDTTVLAHVLREKFGFRTEDIEILSEEQGHADNNLLPTRSNIERAFLKLAQGIRQGDQVVVFLAGHGTELPTPQGNKGYFLPRDVSPWKGDSINGRIPHAIAGVEIGTWLRPIAETGANIWIIVDACFTGRMVRGGAGIVRQLPTDPIYPGGLKVPEKELTNAKRGVEKAENLIPLPTYEGVACLYACKSDEVTLEERISVNDPESQVMGLLTRALGDVLLNSTSELTYQELHERIRKYYAATGRYASPNPVLEGAAIQRIMLQNKRSQRSRLIVSETDDGSLAVNAGLLHGLTAGSIFAVYPPPGQGNRRHGYVQITKVGTISSKCKSIKEDDSPMAKNSLLINGRAEAHRIEFSENRLAVAFDTLEGNTPVAHEHVCAAVYKLLDDLASDKSIGIRMTTSLAEARLHVHIDNNHVFLKPALSDLSSLKASYAEKLSHPIDQELHTWLKSKLVQVSRAHALLHIHANTARSSALKLKTELLSLKTKTSASGEPIAGSVKHVKQGDLVAFEIKNYGPMPIDITILYLDANLELDALFPLKNEDNRIQPGNVLPLEVFCINEKTLGLEYAIIIAVENPAKESIELTALSTARRSIMKSVKQLESPLGNLLMLSIDERNKSRSVNQNLIRSHHMEIIPIEVIPKGM